jgi:uncharacterized membrane protein YeaQ/YmgE (transglycosylase-associated protein family)
MFAAPGAPAPGPVPALVVGPDRSRSGVARALAGPALIVGAGLVWGLLWWQLAPTAATVVQDGGVYLRGHQELMAAQDGWFVVLGSITGALLSTVWPSVSRGGTVRALLAGLVGCVAAGLFAWGLGVWLGPSSLRDQLAAGVKAPITPLVLHTPAALLFAPMLFAAVRGLMELLGSAFANIHTETPPPATHSGAQTVHIQQGQ